MRKTISKILVLCVLFGGLAAAQQFDSQAEQQLVQMLNQERARAGLRSLKVDDRLTQAARAHASLMAQAKRLSHQLPGEPALPKRLAATNLRFNYDAENVARNDSAQGAHDGLMHSPPHRANILSPKYNAVGVGVVRSGRGLWVTEVFAHRLEEYSRDEAENTIIAAFERERRRATGSPAPVVRLPQLRRMACAMAKQGQVDTRAPLNLPDVQSSVAYTESDPRKLPPNAVMMARDPNLKRFAIGACFADSESYPSGTWWVVIVFF
ncbi:MAG: CAP domain-containing protein [Acidobacteriia bacterium]|nr:CAP domain-containing protein [Terriglobia bacterium]